MMKTRSKILAILLTLVLIFSLCSCTKNTAADPNAAATNEAALAQAKDFLSKHDFENIYGVQLNQFLNREYTFKGEKIPQPIVNYQFVERFVELSQYAQAGYFPATVDGFIDLSAAYSKPEEYATYGDFFVNYTEQSLSSFLILNDWATQENLQLSDVTLAEIDHTLVDFESQVYTQTEMNLDDYLQLYYGPGCDTAMFKEILKMNYLADLYADNYYNNYVFNPEDISVPLVRHALFLANMQTATEEQLANASAEAEAFMASINNVDELLSVGQEMLAETQSAAMTVDTNGDPLIPPTYSTIAEVAEYPVDKGLYVVEFEDWAYDEARQVGDIEIIQTVYGYHVMGYVGMGEAGETTKQNIVFTELNDKITAAAASEEYKLFSTDPVPKAQVVTQEMVTAAENKVLKKHQTAQIIKIAIICIAILAVLIIAYLLIDKFVLKKNSKKKSKKNKNKSRPVKVTKPVIEDEDSEDEIDESDDIEESSSDDIEE